jgi:Zn-dependent M32 family carboxypeptidase
MNNMDDIGYSILALRMALDKKIIKPDMSVKEIVEIMKRENLAPYGFKLDESILNEALNPFTEGLPQSDTMMPEDFR